MLATVKRSRANRPRCRRTDRLNPLRRTRPWRRRGRCRFRQLGQGEFQSPLPGTVGLLVPDVEARTFQREPRAGANPGRACAGTSTMPAWVSASGNAREVPHRSLESRFPEAVGADTPDHRRSACLTSPARTLARRRNHERPSPPPGVMIRRTPGKDHCKSGAQLLHDPDPLDPHDHHSPHCVLDHGL